MSDERNVRATHSSITSEQVSDSCIDPRTRQIHRSADLELSRAVIDADQLFARKALNQRDPKCDKTFIVKDTKTEVYAPLHVNTLGLPGIPFLQRVRAQAGWARGPWRVGEQPIKMLPCDALAPLPNIVRLFGCSAGTTTAEGHHPHVTQQSTVDYLTDPPTLVVVHHYQ